VFASQGQEAFIEGHVEAFRVLGGVPTDKIRYDNLRSVVSRVMFGRNRTESGRWVSAAPENWTVSAVKSEHSTIGV
jgi:transposase